MSASGGSSPSAPTTGVALCHAKVTVLNQTGQKSLHPSQVIHIPMTYCDQEGGVDATVEWTNVGSSTHFKLPNTFEVLDFSGHDGPNGKKLQPSDEGDLNPSYDTLRAVVNTVKAGADSVVFSNPTTMNSVVIVE